MCDLPNQEKLQEDTMSNQHLYIQMKALLQQAYQGQNQAVVDHMLKTLAMMVTGVILGPHVQLYAIAMCVPLPIKLPSIVRRFSGFVADSRVDVQTLFAPFVYAMQATLSAESVYLIIRIIIKKREATLFHFPFIMIIERMF